MSSVSGCYKSGEAALFFCNENTELHAFKSNKQPPKILIITACNPAQPLNKLPCFILTHTLGHKLYVVDFLNQTRKELVAALLLFL